MSRRRRSPGHALLLALGLFVILGHVCALPAHAAGLDAVLAHTDAAHDHQPADESMHGGSCEAVPSTVVDQPPVVSAATAVSVALVTRPLRPSLERLLPAVTKSPPLFLLHTALLIYQ